MSETTKPPPGGAPPAYRGVPLFSRHVKVRIEVEAPADGVAAVFGALAGLMSPDDPALAATVKALIASGRANADDARAATARLDELTRVVAEYGDTAADLRAEMERRFGRDPYPPVKPGTLPDCTLPDLPAHPWDDGGGDGDDSARDVM